MVSARMAEWNRREAEKRANCVAHRYDNEFHMGIVGWRTMCSKCGDWFNPDRHTADDECELHPDRNGWDKVDSPTQSESE